MFFQSILHDILPVSSALWMPKCKSKQNCNVCNVCRFQVAVFFLSVIKLFWHEVHVPVPVDNWVKCSPCTNLNLLTTYFYLLCVWCKFISFTLDVDNWVYCSACTNLNLLTAYFYLLCVWCIFISITLDVSWVFPFLNILLSVKVLCCMLTGW